MFQEENLNKMVEPKDSQDKQAGESSEVVHQKKEPSQLDVNFQAKSEKDLIIYTANLYYKAGRTLIKCYWLIGQGINNFYKKSYGEDELEKIATATGISKGTLRKACQFARQYSFKQLNILLDCPVRLSWRALAQNLSIGADKFLQVCQNSTTRWQFNNAVIKLKNPNERRGRVANPPSTSDESKVSGIDEKNRAYVTTEVTALADSEPEVDEIQVDGLADIDDAEILKAKIIKLQNVLNEKDRQLQLKDQRIAELEKEVEELKDTIEYYEEDYKVYAKQSPEFDASNPNGPSQ